MKNQHKQSASQLAPAMVEDKATERRKKRDMKAGLIVIAHDGKATKQEAVKKGSLR